jgi:glyoxylase-like metal-dependent hydrolase (beta-lactamase superfamily II)
MFLDTMTVGPIGTNCYLLGDESTHQCAIIDPGAGAQAIVRRVEALGYTPVAILLTHGHYDHVTAVRGLLQVWGSLPVYLHPADYPTAPAGPYSPTGLGDLQEIRFYQEGDTVAIGNLTVQVLSTPGHTAGGVTLLVEDALFTGDTLFAGSCGRTDFETSSVPDMMASLRRLALLEGDYRVYPGHDRASTLERERRTNPYLQYAMKGQ